MNHDIVNNYTVNPTSKTDKLGTGIASPSLPGALAGPRWALPRPLGRERPEARTEEEQRVTGACP
jgi:hypothetical protein